VCKLENYLPILCVALGAGVDWWAAWLTDDEIAELVETYGVSYDDGTKSGKNGDGVNGSENTGGCGK